MNFENHVTRLSQYKSALQRFEKDGIERTHAETIATYISIPATQIRKDFSLFGIRGNKRGGYNVKELLEELKNILGLNRANPFILIGYGNLGKALTRYPGFHEGCVQIVAAFDPGVGLLSSQPLIPIYPPASIPSYLKENPIKHAILAVPDDVAQAMFDELYKAGIRGFLNFTTVALTVPDDAYVNNIDLKLELETVIFYTKELVNKKR
ncbi:MAG: redox-sensing transcriptional repressor Rex [Candidatus Marinimicrobia bacterium]|nr:redox-sensing transcriptional repressor Rex [Candidatus Neomarinimicrobiota bacterium]